MEKPILDEVCKNIFSVLLVSDKGLRFNKLHGTLNQIGLKMSKPTLIKHLRHLQKRKLLIRKKEGKQNVSYKVNWERLETLQQSMKARQMAKNLLENKKRFKSFPINEQATYVTNILTLSNLYKLKLETQAIFNPRKNFENSIQFLFIYRFFEFFKTWLLENCQEAKTNEREKIIKTIDYNIQHIQNELFNEQLLTEQPK